MSARPVCHHCVGNPYLGDKIRSEGFYASCDYCGTIQWVLSTKAVAEAFDTLFDNYFEPECDDAGAYTVRELVELIGNAKGRITTDICRECRYESAAELTERPLAEGAYLPWINFCQSLSVEGRFFNRAAEEQLAAALGDIQTVSTLGTGVVTELTPASPPLHRARVALTEQDLIKILTYPSAELGPPPAELARAGRLNADGISVFYGALDERTCIAEVRPPVGSFVVAASFGVLRPLKMLDLRNLAGSDLDLRLYSEDFFAPDFIDRRKRRYFLSRFEQEICRPVMPNHEHRGYLPTQAMSEYLAVKATPPIDGLMYGSTQAGYAPGNMVYGQSPPGADARNVVLFRKSALVAADSVRYDVKIERLDDGEFLVRTHELEQEAISCGSSTATGREPALRLLYESIRILRVTSASFGMEEVDWPYR